MLNNGISIMYCILPKSRKGSILWENFTVGDCCPSDIKNYIECLSKYVGGKNVSIKYHDVDNAVEFIIEGTYDDYELLKQQCEGFDYVMKNKPFLQTYFLEKDGTLIKKEKEVEKDETILKSYVSESLFLDGILRPDESNISPKSDDEIDTTTGYKCRRSENGAKYIDLLSEENFGVYPWVAEYKGRFLIFEDKYYSYYWDSENKKETKIETLLFKMLDNGNFDCEVLIQDDSTVIVETDVNITRNVFGHNFDGKSVRDGMFPDFPHDDFIGSICIREYFKVLSNNSRLLHYSDYSDYFEIYELPNNWTVQTGISKLESPKVFDDIHYDEYDKDLEEVKSILNSRENIKKEGYVLKKINNCSKFSVD